jgi:ATP-binding cassette subfamily F protein 3
LEKALTEYEGAVFCVSHDRYFLDSFAEKIFSIENSAVEIYLGNYSDYKAKQDSSRSVPNKTRSEPEKPERAPAERRINPQIINKVRIKIEALEEKIDNLENEIAALEGSSDWQKLTKLLETRDDYYGELESLHEEMDNLKSGN